MRIAVILLYFFIFLVAGKMAPAQSQVSGWITNFSTFKLSNKFSIYFVAQLRSTDQAEHVSGLLVYTGLAMQVRKNMTASAGYAFNYGRRDLEGVTGYAPEQRIWEQYVISDPAGSITFVHRVRLEQRFIANSVVENNSLKREGNVFANRFRYSVRGTVPFGKKMQPKTPFISIQDELLLNFGDKTGVNGEIFDQNRTGLGLGYRFSQAVDLEIGYMNQYINEGDHDFTNNHILQLITYLRL